MAIDEERFGPDDVSLAWKKEFEATHGRIAVGVREYDPGEDNEEQPAHALLTRGMDPDHVKAMLKGSLTLRSAPGDRVLARGDGGVVVGVVAKGVVHVVVNDRVIAALGRGEPFGEMAFATGQPRTADLVAASPGTELLQFSPSALAHLPMAAQAALWKNLSWCLARRLATTTTTAAAR